MKHNLNIHQRVSSTSACERNMPEDKQRKDLSQFSVKLRINNKLVDLKELVRVCNEHCLNCENFENVIGIVGH